MDAQAMVSALPSWRAGASRRAIVDFLVRVTLGPDAVPPTERVATFDNDGTLACEKPRTALAAFLEAESIAAGNGPLAGASGHEVLRELGALFAGTTVADYETRCRAFLAGATHPRFGMGYPALVYAPMRELVTLLHDLEFSVFLCSDSSRDFNRVLAGPAYGLRRERVIGSEVRIKLRNDVLVRSATPVPLNDGPGKAVHIWDRAGQRPLFAAGNAVGDIEMLDAARFALLVHHDDPDREYGYDDVPALAAARDSGWTVVSMRDDFDTMWSRGTPNVPVAG
jgi:phosphoserine phosphatase